mgnify:CR=1 FL=1
MHRVRGQQPLAEGHGVDETLDRRAAQAERKRGMAEGGQEVKLLRLAPEPPSDGERGDETPPRGFVFARGQVRFADLKSNPLGARLFREADQVTVDGDAARFLEETRLRPTEDVDVLTVAFRSNTNGSRS